MIKLINYFRQSLVLKLIIIAGTTLLISISTLVYFSTKHHKQKVMKEIMASADRLGNTIKLSTHYAMMLDSNDDINQIINNIAKQKEIESIRIYNKKGQIKFSSKISEVDQITSIKDEACYVCHRTNPPPDKLSLKERTRIFNSSDGYRQLGIIYPILNEPDCVTSCHIHSKDEKILGAFDLVISLAEKEKEIMLFIKLIIGTGILVFIILSSIITIVVIRFINLPIKQMTAATDRIADGDFFTPLNVRQNDEMGRLAASINKMGANIGEKQIELNKQKDQYQTLFELVPCLITVQDKKYKLLSYNRKFADMFDPKPDDHCYYAYKGLNKKCDDCPVERTFKDGKQHHGEQTGINKDGTISHWIVKTAGITDSSGKIVSAMEMSIDITPRKKLEQKLKKSEANYYAIFNNMPCPVFVLDVKTLKIVNCNEIVKAVYGYSRKEIIQTSYLDLFYNREKKDLRKIITGSSFINKIRHINKAGKIIFVNIRISPSEYSGLKVLLIAATDITKRLETEQQLVQAGKLATLGEMATGVAHELNQPLSVMKTASSFFIKKINNQEEIDNKILFTMLEKIDVNVDRASKIINHMRQFARKSEPGLEKVEVNKIIEKTLEIFSRQLKARGIELVLEIEKNLPKINADPARLEQVFLNLIINARDAIEENILLSKDVITEKEIILKTQSTAENIICSICDTGTGVSEEIIDKVFEPFFTTKEVGKGTGIGLSISYGIVKEFGGTIKVEPNIKHGACFIITFPRLR